MTAVTQSLTGAPSTGLAEWDFIHWDAAGKQVRRLQVRIAKAIREGRKSKTKALQRLLTHSFYAKCLAVRRVVSNKGGNTPGVDGVLWRTSHQRMHAVSALKRKGYKSLPLRRIHIPKKDPRRGLRPLSIPCISDRAMQALHHLALEPIAEERADPNSYGFRPKRSVADAIEQCFVALSRRWSPQWVFEGDIRSCFDKIDHTWIKENILMDHKILGKFLEAGYMEKGVIYPTSGGTPQGGVISPTIALMALAGLEKTLKERFKKAKVNVVVYADDCIITCESKELLEQEIIPTVEMFLKIRGLELSKEKSKITHIEDGFDFLGHNIRKYDGVLLIKPAKANVQNFLREIRDLIKSAGAAKTEIMIYRLNSKIRGWANFYRHVVSSRTFSYVDNQIYHALWRWMLKRHPNKGKVWLYRKYFRQTRLQVGLKRWQFYTKFRRKDQSFGYLHLALAGKVHIRRHVKIKGAATPYKPEFKEYFEQRARYKKVRRTKGNVDNYCPDTTMDRATEKVA